MNKITQFITILIIPIYTQAQLSEPRDIEFVTSFKNAFQTNDPAQIAYYIDFPLDRPYPIKNILDSIEFVQRFSEVFSNEIILEINESDPEKSWTNMGYRGIMLNNGSLWLDSFEKKLISVSTKNKETLKLLKTTTEVQKKSLHSSVRNFEKAILRMQTKKFLIRIDRMANGTYRYASWSRPKKTSKKPDLVLFNGEKFFNGSGGNHSYSFNHKNYSYTCQVYILGFNHIPAELQVHKDSSLFHTEVATEIDY